MLLPALHSVPHPFAPPIPLEFRVEVKLDKWMLMLNINHLLGLIINLTSDSKQTFHLCNFPVSRLHFPFSPPHSLCGNFVMHFIYSQRQILIYRGDTAYAAFSRPAKSPYTRSYFTLDRRERKKGRERQRGEKRGRTAVLLGAPKF